MKKKIKVFKIFLDTINAILYINVRITKPNTIVYKAYTIYDNAYKSYIKTEKDILESINRFKEVKYIKEMNNVDTHYLKKGGAIRFFTTSGLERYYIFLNTKHKYTSPLYTIRLGTFLITKSMYSLLFRKNIYLSCDSQLPKIKSIVNFLKYFIGGK